MKIGLAIIAFIFAVAAGLYLLERHEPVDQPTQATSETKLAAAELPDDLPVLFATTQAPVHALGFDAIGVETANAQGLLSTGDTQDLDRQADAVCEVLLALVLGEPLADGFVDERIAPSELFSEELRQLFRVVALAVDQRLGRLMAEADYESADLLARAQFELGRKVFVQNTRLRARQHGLGLMRSGITQARHVAQAMAQDESAQPTRLDAVASDLDAWDTALARIESQWREKIAMISSSNPNVADLIQVAQRDGDRSFRVFATHQLGYARFETAQPGNQRMIAQQIERASSSEDSLIRQAARFARSMSREQFYAQAP